MANFAALLCAISGVATLATDDSQALIQSHISTHLDGGELSMLLDKTIKQQNRTLKGILSLAQEQSRTLAQPQAKASVREFAQSSALAAAGHKRALARGWREFARRAGSPASPAPRELLRHAKAALLETGALEEMRQVAARAARAETQGAVPLDSMVVGFYTSLAPWNNVLKEFSLPLIKAQFSLSANFFGPEGNAARLCVGAQIALDSTYGPHSRSEFGGIGVFVGPSKWDNVPGWRFGATGGMDDIAMFDVADFGWDWTLAQEPETVGFHFDIAVIDSEGLHASMLQTEAETRSVEGSGSIPNHGSTFLGHTWCSPDWENTPLVISDSSTAVAKESSNKMAKAGEEWDPADDAV